MEEVAARLGVTKRTLRAWKAKAKKDCDKRSGRPSYTIEDHRRALLLVARELKKQGYPGSPAIASALSKKVPLRLIRLYVGKIKARRRIKLRELHLQNRISTIVKSANVIWSQDGTHLGRNKKRSVEAQVIKDRASLKVLSILTGNSADGKTIVAMFKELKKTRSLPLVWMTDNGSCYVNKEVEKFMSDERIIHLRSLPHTPQHNGSAERMMFELKTASLLGRKTLVNDNLKVHEAFTTSALIINEYRKRAVLGFKSSNEVDEEMLMTEPNVSREQLYAEYAEEKKRLHENICGRELRMCEREMVMCLLEKYDLINRSRGIKEYVA